jgi:hypothetical protein
MMGVPTQKMVTVPQSTDLTLSLLMDLAVNANQGKASIGSLGEPFQN